MRILHITTIDQACAATPADVKPLTLTPSPAITNLTTDGDARRDAWDASAFWPELNPRTREELIRKGYGEEVAAARSIAPELARAIDKGFPIPPALRARAVYETYKIMMSGNRTEKLRAVEVLDRMHRASLSPNALPDQLKPETTTNVQVNIQNNPPAPSASVAELVDELLSRADVQQALDADVPGKDFDYAM